MRQKQGVSGAASRFALSSEPVRLATVVATGIERRSHLDTYVILRRNGWLTADDLTAAAERSSAEGERMRDDVAWIRSYVLDERDGRVGTVCVYQASSPEAIRRHASEAVLPVDEIVKVADTVVLRPDPAATAA